MGAYELQNHSVIPLIYDVSGVASTCAGGANDPVTLSNSQLYVNYQFGARTAVQQACSHTPHVLYGTSLVFNRLFFLL
jgi:hypothetical protein